MLELVAAVESTDDYVCELAAFRHALDPRDQLTPRRADHLDLDERKALVEGLDDLLLHLGEVGGIEDQRSFLLRRLDQFGRTEGILRLLRQAGLDGERGRQSERAGHERTA